MNICKFAKFFKSDRQSQETHLTTLLTLVQMQRCSLAELLVDLHMYSFLDDHLCLDIEQNGMAKIVLKRRVVWKKIPNDKFQQVQLYFYQAAIPVK